MRAYCGGLRIGARNCPKNSRMLLNGKQMTNNGIIKCCTLKIRGGGVKWTDTARKPEKVH